MFRPLAIITFFAVSASVAPAVAADAQHPTREQKQLPGRTNEASKVKTFNLGAASEEANSVISQGYSVNGTIYISGQYSHDKESAVTGEGDFGVQTRQTFKNIDRVLAGFNVTKSNIAEMVIYLTNPREQSEPFALLLKEYVGLHRPAVTVVGVTGLYYPQQLIEIRVVAHAK